MARKRERSGALEARVPGEVVGEANGLPIRRLKVSEVDASTYNPRTITERAADALRASVDAFGLVQPLVWNVRTGRLVGGHQRLKTLDPSGTTDVVQVDLDEVREKALNAQLNNRAAQGEFTVDVTKILDEVEAALPELYSKLALPDVRIEVPDVSSLLGGPDEGGEPDLEDASSETRHECPSCGHRF